jgi:aspartyl-tRNA(Asn)/glutamyl-tRNA(Gln) amidotransferase subunit C
MSKKSELTKDDIIHLGKLANLQLNEEEMTSLQNQLSETLQFVENLHELDTENVAPTNHITNQKNIHFEDGTECTRMLTQDEALKNASEKKNKYFIVKRIAGM